MVDCTINLWTGDGLGIQISFFMGHIELYKISTGEEVDETWEELHEGQDEHHYRKFLGLLQAKDLGDFLAVVAAVLNQKLRTPEE